MLTGILAICINCTTFSVISQHGPAFYMMLGPLKTIAVVAIANSWGSTRQCVSIVGAAITITDYYRRIVGRKRQ